MGWKAQSLAHTKWLYKYHIVFAPKYRRKIIFAELRTSIKEILRDLCKYKGVEILEGHLIRMKWLLTPDESLARREKRRE